MSPNKQRLGVFYIMLLYVGITAVGFFIAYLVKSSWQQHQQTAFSPTPAVVQTTPLPTPTDWKTYKNSAANFQFAYPPMDIVTTSSYGLGVTSVLITNDTDPDFQILIMPKTLAQAVGQNFDTYYFLPNNTTTSIKSPLAKDDTKQQFTKLQNRTVDGLQAFDYRALPANAADTQPEIGTFLQAGSNLILISTTADNKENLEKMLSTFSYRH